MYWNFRPAEREKERERERERCIIGATNVTEGGIRFKRVLANGIDIDSTGELNTVQLLQRLFDKSFDVASRFRVSGFSKREGGCKENMRRH